MNPEVSTGGVTPNGDTKKRDWRKSEKRHRSALIALRATPEEHAELLRQAEARGTSVGNLIREALGWQPC